MTSSGPSRTWMSCGPMRRPDGHARKTVRSFGLAKKTDTNKVMTAAWTKRNPSLKEKDAKVDVVAHHLRRTRRTMRTITKNLVNIECAETLVRKKDISNITPMAVEDVILVAIWNRWRVPSGTNRVDQNMQTKMAATKNVVNIECAETLVRKEDIGNIVPVAVEDVILVAIWNRQCAPSGMNQVNEDMETKDMEPEESSSRMGSNLKSHLLCVDFIKMWAIRTLTNWHVILDLLELTQVWWLQPNPSPATRAPGTVAVDRPDLQARRTFLRSIRRSGSTFSRSMT